jgi:L-Ala-D/L-Glu epimerase
MRIEFQTIGLRTRYPFRIARLKEPPPRHAVHVRLIAADGVEGWGEAAPTVFYGETADTVAAVLPRLAAAALDAAGGDVLALERVERALALTLGGNMAAKTAISAAFHDLAGKQLGVPLWRLWGLDPALAPTSTYTIGIDEPAIVKERVAAAAAYPVLKVKVGTPQDEAMLRAIREVAPDKPLRVDANTAWSAGEAVARLPLLLEYGVELLEQPVAAHDIDGLRLVRARSPIPVVADESCRVATDIPPLAGAVDGVNIKLAKCGSLREALRMVHVARAHGMKVMLGCMVETTLGIAAALQLAPLVDYADLDGAALLAEDPFLGPGLGEEGRLRFNQEPGLGVSARG